MRLSWRDEAPVLVVPPAITLPIVYIPVRYRSIAFPTRGRLASSVSFARFRGLVRTTARVVGMRRALVPTITYDYRLLE